MRLLRPYTAKLDDLCRFAALGDKLPRRFADLTFNRNVSFLLKYGRTVSYGEVPYDFRLDGPLKFKVKTAQGGEVSVPLVSAKHVKAFKKLASKRSKGNEIVNIVEEVGVVKQLDYVIAHTKRMTNKVKYHHIEFKPVAVDLEAKPFIPVQNEDTPLDACYFAPLKPDVRIMRMACDATHRGIVVYPLFNRFAAYNGFLVKKEFSHAGFRTEHIGTYLPCICVRMRGSTDKVYEISLDHCGDDVEVLATTKIVEKVEGIIRAQINSALLGVGNEKLRQVLCENKYYRCDYRRYTNEEFVKDAAILRAEYAAKFTDVWEMISALDLSALNHEECCAAWEICNSIVNK